MILPVAVVVGVLQIFVASPRGGTGGWEDLHQQVSNALPLFDSGAGAQHAESESQGLPLPDPRALTRSASAADEVTEAPSAPIRIVIHHAAGSENALPAIQLAVFLQEQGFEVSEIRPVDTEVERPSVRYFFDGDQPGTRPLIEAVAAFFAEAPDQASAAVADLTDISPKPSEGKVEVWLPPPAAGEPPST